MGLYTENAVVFPSSSEILIGRTAIQTYLDGLRKVGVKEYSISKIGTILKKTLLMNLPFGKQRVLIAKVTSPMCLKNRMMVAGRSNSRAGIKFPSPIYG